MLGFTLIDQGAEEAIKHNINLETYINQQNISNLKNRAIGFSVVSHLFTLCL